jgi:hypothetical protein
MTSDDRTAIMVGGPMDGHVVRISGGGFEAAELREDVLSKVTYRDSNHMVDGVHVYVVDPSWTPPPFEYYVAKRLWHQVMYSAYACTLGPPDPMSNPISKAFTAAWRTHYPKASVPFDRNVGAAATAISTAQCGGHAKLWPCADATAMMKPFVVTGQVRFLR